MLGEPTDIARAEEGMNHAVSVGGGDASTEKEGVVPVRI